MCHRRVTLTIVLRWNGRRSLLRLFFSLLYFSWVLQCMFRPGGADVTAADSMRTTVGKAENADQFFGGTDPPPVLTVAAGTQAAAVGNLSSAELCNVLYFSVLPRDVNATNAVGLPDIRYSFNGSAWSAIGVGPYFQSPTENLRRGSPEEGLQVFITARGAQLPEGGVTSLADTALLGPNSQANILFSRRREDDQLRYTISSISSSNNLKVEPAEFAGTVHPRRLTRVLLASAIDPLGAIISFSPAWTSLANHFWTSPFPHSWNPFDWSPHHCLHGN